MVREENAEAENVTLEFKEADPKSTTLCEKNMTIEPKDVLNLLEAVPKLRSLVMRWARQAGVMPERDASVRLGSGRYASFADCRGIMDVITATRLGGGRKAQRHLGVRGTPCEETIKVSITEGDLSFQDVELGHAEEGGAL